MAIRDDGATTSANYELAAAGRAGRKGVWIQNQTATDELMEVAIANSDSVAPTGVGFALATIVTNGVTRGDDSSNIFLETPEAVWVKRTTANNVSWLMLDL